MDLRLDRIIRRGTAGDQSVYSLLLAEEGLYLFHTGSVGGLVPAEEVQRPVRLVVNETTLPLIEHLIKSEARVKSLSPEDLINEDGNVLVTFESMEEVRVNVIPGHSRLHFQTKQGIFDFVFTAADGDLPEVALFFDRLTQRIEDA